MVKRYDEFLEVSRIQEDINRLFDQLMRQPEDRVDGAVQGGFNPSTDIVESDTDLILRLEVPGIALEDLALTLTGNTLTVFGVKKPPCHDDKGVNFVCMERSYGKFSRSVYVNFSINTHKANAELQGGVLTVRLPKVKDRRGEAVTIPVRALPDEESRDE